MATPRIGSPGVGLPSPGINSNLQSSYITLSGGQKQIIPSGTYALDLGPYTILQELDPVSGLWNVSTSPDNGSVNSDGTNFRIANLTGCAVGALITTAGSGYLTPPAVTPSIGNSTWKAVLGGRLNPTVTVATTGIGYVHQPQILLPPPPAGGVQATATATITAAGLLTGITLNNTGAGYTQAPTALPATIGALAGNTFGPSLNTYQIIPDPADTITTPAVLTFALDTNTATNLSAILLQDPGESVTSVPTLAITAAPTGGTTAAATAIMMFTVTGVSSAGGGVNYSPGSAIIIAPGTYVSGTSAITNPVVDKGLFTPIPTFGTLAVTAGVVTTTSTVISNGGLHQAVPILGVVNTGVSVPTTGAQFSALVGGITDTSILYRV